MPEENEEPELPGSDDEELNWWEPGDMAEPESLSASEIWADPPPFFPVDLRPEVDDDRTPVRVVVEGVYKSMLLDEEQHFVRLTGADHMLSIVIGPFEAQAILLPLQEVKSDRPMTHDLLQTMIERLGARVVSVLIDDLWNDFYYAKIQLKQGKERFEVDSRPSDALALAVRFDVPIFVTERVLEIADQKLED